MKIPKGTVQDSRIRLKGQGDRGIGNGQPGDLYLNISIIPHKKFEILGLDLSTEILVSPWVAILGGKIEVPTMEGVVEITLPAGTQGNQRFRLKGKGMDKGSKKGDLYAIIKIDIPKVITQEERELIEELSQMAKS